VRSVVSDPDFKRNWGWD